MMTQYEISIEIITKSETNSKYYLNHDFDDNDENYNYEYDDDDEYYDDESGSY